ncbi:Major Facilitator Superfamily protein [Parafrankia irregularis]|uniref:Major Facilitator Superfamily protein n=1 Tax=Parafrankia irregularis TaxID=795642 RepID=A0A0S4QGW7_9ACTN|nr:MULTISPECIES: MFS transporter [Parafrankia]CUU54816.1 Major Facilitator Superfamily protein [Parafrankia irregularis]
MTNLLQTLGRYVHTKPNPARPARTNRTRPDERSGAHQQPGAVAHTHPHPGLLLGVLIYCGLVIAVIGTLGTPLIPLIADAQHVSLSDAQWLLTLTLLTGAASTPLLGRLGDGPHRRTVLLAGLGTVAAGSLLAATANGFTQLLVGRGLMGVGVGLMPLALAIARDLLPPRQLAAGIGALSITVATGAGLGYPLSGLIAESFDYHAGFWVAAVLTAAAMAAVLAVVPGRASTRAARGPVDLVGALLFAAGLSPLLVALSEGESWGWTSPRIIALFGSGIVCLVAWIMLELHSAHPLVELKYLAARPVLIADVCAILAGFGMFNAMTLINRLAQAPTSTGYGFGASPAVLGLVILPLAVGTVLASRWSRWLGPRTGGGRGLLLVGLFAVALAEFGLAVRHDHLVELGGATFLFGVGIGLAFAAMPGLIIGSVPPHETGSATSFNQVLRTVGGSVGSALGAAMLAAHTPAGATEPSNSGYTVAFVIAGGVGVLAMLAALALPSSPRAGEPAVPASRQAELETLQEEAADAAASGLVMADDVEP